jgi:hypothetical protein
MKRLFIGLLLAAIILESYTRINFETCEECFTTPLNEKCPPYEKAIPAIFQYLQTKCPSDISVLISNESAIIHTSFPLQVEGISTMVSTRNEMSSDTETMSIMIHGCYIYQHSL